MAATQTIERICALAQRAGRIERCTGDCPLFEHGECSLEALTAAGDLGDDLWRDDESDPLSGYAAEPSLRPAAGL